MVTKARAERNAMDVLNKDAKSLPPRDVSAHPFWSAIKQPKKIAAPMVRHTDHPCRMLLRKHGAELCYTSMIDSDKFIAAKPADRSKFFTTSPEDRPLIAQFGAKNAADFVGAGKLLQDSVDGVCLNMDCPQRRAEQQKFGAFLMKDNMPEVFNIVRRAAKELTVPICAKIRLLSLPASCGNGGLPGIPLVSETIAFCKKLEEAGASLIAIHGRTIDMKNHRSMHPADHVAINAIRKHLTIPVVANGDVQSMKDLSNCLDVTGAEGAMVATELMYNPHLFEMEPKADRYECTPTKQLAFAAEYQHMCSIYEGGTPGTLMSHLVDTVIVPALSPESCRAMIPFGDGVDCLAKATMRLDEIALVLGVACKGVDKCVALKDVERDVFLTLKEAEGCVRWLGAGGECKTAEGRIARVGELFERGVELMKGFAAGSEPPSLGKRAEEEAEKKKSKKRDREGNGQTEKVAKAARKAMKKAEVGGMTLKALTKAVMEKVGVEEGRAKEVKKLVKAAIKDSTKMALEGKTVTYLVD